MLEAIIGWSLRSRLFVMLLAVVVVIVGFYSLSVLNFDAFPDTTPVQVQINTQAPGLVPEEVEKQITFRWKWPSAGSAGSSKFEAFRSSDSPASSSLSATAPTSTSPAN